MNILWIIAKHKILQSAWVKVLGTLLDESQITIMSSSSVVALPVNFNIKDKVLIVYGSLEDKEEQFAAWNLWHKRNNNKNVIKSFQCDVVSVIKHCNRFF